jgi:phosphate ABC transporter phosphate-binding protein
MALAGVAALLVPVRGMPQTEGGARAVRTIYVAPLTDSAQAEAMRQRLIERLRKSGSVRVVDEAGGADAVLHSRAVIWQTGTVSVNPRSNSVMLRNYQGYLSAELSDAAHRPLWSYLVTPSRFRMTNIVDDLADQMGARLAAAVAGGGLGTAKAGGTKAGTGVALKVAGGTFPAPLYELWFRSFGAEPDGAPMSYTAEGSVAGFADLVAGKVDLAATDIPAQEEVTKSPLAVLQVPAVVGGVVPIYNLPGDTIGLNFTPQLLADIFAGKIKRWNDPAIRQWNKGVHLPDAEIVVVHRTDGSGTTYVWTSFLARESADWKGREGATVEWPVGLGARGNDGVADTVLKTPNSIAYTELTFAIQRELNYGAVRNPAGRFIRADLASITAAVNAHVHASEGDLRYLTLNSPAKGAYPIATFTWLLVPKVQADAAKRAEIAAFLRWMLTTGQKECSALGYVPLPADVVREELGEVDGLK